MVRFKIFLVLLQFMNCPDILNRQIQNFKQLCVKMSKHIIHVFVLFSLSAVRPYCK